MSGESHTPSISSSVVGDDNDHKKHQHHNRETHGLREDIGVETPITDVKAPNVFERAKEEIEAIVQAIHPKPKKQTLAHNHDSHDPPREKEKEKETKQHSSDSHSPPPEKSKKSHNIFEKAKQDFKGKLHKDKPVHDKETHGRSDDIDEKTPIVEVKGPNVFERAKEEFEAVVEALHPKKDSEKAKTKSSPKEGGGFGVSIGRKLEKICSPGSHNKD